MEHKVVLFVHFRELQQKRIFSKVRDPKLCHNPTRSWWVAVLMKRCVWVWNPHGHLPLLEELLQA